MTALTVLVTLFALASPTAASASSTVSVKPGSTASVSVSTSLVRDARVSATASLKALPNRGGGVYTSVHVRSGSAGAYLGQVRTYPDGTLHLTIKRANGTGTAQTVTSLTSSTPVKGKLKPGQRFTLSLTATGTTRVALRASVQVAGQPAPLVVTATDATASRVSGAGQSSVTFYTSKQSPAVSVAVASTELTHVATTPPKAPVVTPKPKPKPKPTTPPEAPVVTPKPKPKPTTPPEAPVVTPKPKPKPTTPPKAPVVTPKPTTPTSPPPADFPSAATTGVPEGVALKVHEGDIRVREPNTVIDGLEVRGIIVIEAPGVVIKNSRIVGGVKPSSIGLVSNVGSGHSFTIRDSELYAAHEDPLWYGILGSNFTAERVNIHHVVDPIHIAGDNVTVRDSWLHDSSYWKRDRLRNGTPTHDDSIQIVAGGNILIEGNRMEDAHNAAIQISQSTSRARLGSIIIRDNHLQGGGCTVNVARTPNAVHPVIEDNVFGPERTFATCAVTAPRENAPKLHDNIWEATKSAMSHYVIVE